jgi:sigma-B regulation protein RsbU (phosphoserine phosphatase)
MNGDNLRSQLSDRRKQLQSAVSRFGRSDHFANLLREVDDALAKLDKHTFGLCETCGDSIEEERLAVDPLLRNCLDHLTTSEQRVLEHDLDLAYQVQSGLLPKQGAHLGGWSIVYHYEAAGPVSGDYLDIVPLQHEPGSFLFLMGDVTGKGVAAAILMSQLHAIFRSLSRSRLPVGELLEQANRLFCEGTTSRYFATLVFGKISSNGDVEISNAGHCSPALVRASELKTIAPTALPLGMFCQGAFASRTVATEPGDRIVLYSDGLTEARNKEDEFYGLDDLKAFRSGAERLDDLTIMILGR